MNRLKVRIERVQHIQLLTLELDLSKPGILCLVGRNGVGKTTLVRALANLSNSDTFIRTAPPRIFDAESSIRYEADDTVITFTYDEALRTLNCRQVIPVAMRNAVLAELPIPYGARFHYAKSASDADEVIRRAIALEEFSRPTELAEFLNEIYGINDYDNLIEISVKAKKHYAIVRPDGTYLREDYLSSGEYFLINLYRTIKANASLVVVDEIDLSLDAAAQAKLTPWLRSFCHEYGCTIVFTTHSLAIMKTLEVSELAFLDKREDQTVVEPSSYSHAKARLFGFYGWDRYILTEDKTLMGLIEYLISQRCPPSFLRCKIIYIGGGQQVADLLARNAADRFLGEPGQVMAIIDGDRAGQPYAAAPGVHLAPVQNVEQALFDLWKGDANFPFTCRRSDIARPKEFFNYLQETRATTAAEIYDYVVSSNRAAFEPLIGIISEFLGRPIGKSAIG